MKQLAAALIIVVGLTGCGGSSQISSTGASARPTSHRPAIHQSMRHVPRSTLREHERRTRSLGVITYETEIPTIGE
jgi:hypothetical protein